jgi:hypothetical protein
MYKHMQQWDDDRDDRRALENVYTKPSKQFRSHPDGEKPPACLGSGLRGKTRRFRQ